MSIFECLANIPSDPIFELTKDYNADEYPQKVNLGQGTYKDEKGDPWVLPSVKLAKARLEDTNHEYLPILGLPAFRSSATKLVLGNEADSNTFDKVATCQALSGTGSLNLAGRLLRRTLNTDATVYITEPTWSNHRAVFEDCGFKVASYTYFESASGRLDYQSLLETLRTAPEGSIFVLHACAHNPSGCDPSDEQWQEIAQIMKARHLFPLFDAAYLGLTSGNYDQDASAIRFFIYKMEMEVCVCLSFAKSMGLYGERIGAVIFHSNSHASAVAIQSNLEQLQRSQVSNPPAFGAKIVSLVLTDSKLDAMWRQELVSMSSRIKRMRQRLLEEILSLGCPKNFQHIVDQRGMFCILGLTREQVKTLQDIHHIYMASSSRISIAGLNEGNVAYVAKAINEVVHN